MQKEMFRQIGFTIIRNTDDTAFVDIPLYIKVTEVDSNGLTPEERKLVDIVTEIIIKGNELKIADKFASLKKGVKRNEENNIPC